MRSIGPFRNRWSCPGHQVSQSAEIVGGSRKGEQPPPLVHPSQFPYEFLWVVVLVATQGHALSSGDRLRHEHRRISFRSTIGLRQKSLHQQPVAILHHYMSQV